MPSNLPLTFPLLFFAGFLVIFIIAIVAGLAVRGQRSRQQREAAERGLRTLMSCRICDGPLEPAVLWTYRSLIVLRRGGRNEQIGAVRCTLCGHIDLFS